MSKSTKILAVSFSAACIIIIVTKPETYIASASTGIKLWATTVVPSLLPFFFFTALLTATGITEKISEVDLGDFRDQVTFDEDNLLSLRLPAIWEML